MLITLILIGAIVLAIVYFVKRRNDRNQLEQHSITPEVLHELLSSGQDVLVFDVRLPLDLLSDAEIIPGAARIPPAELVKNPSLIPHEKDVIVYCTCPSDKTSIAILRKALAMQFLRVRLLRGGLEGWKAKGFPVEAYRQSFHLDTAS